MTRYVGICPGCGGPVGHGGTCREQIGAVLDMMLSDTVSGINKPDDIVIEKHAKICEGLKGKASDEMTYNDACDHCASAIRSSQPGPMGNKKHFNVEAEALADALETVTHCWDFDYEVKHGKPCMRCRGCVARSALEKYRDG